MRKLDKLVVGAVIALSVSVAGPAAAQSSETVAEPAEAEVKKTAKKKKKKITDRRHPDYVRCRSEPVIGSLARKKRVCMTNAQWAEASRTGNKNSREFVDDMQVGMNQSN